ncbi:MAG: dihydroorotase [Bacteroidales bacterium]|nr:dihydroorotase [Bacteroidales bacterium]
MIPLLIHDALIINEGRSFTGSVLVEVDHIVRVFEGKVPESVLSACKMVDASGKWLIPGVIDDHVHFRDPGLTHKADLTTESKAALAGGVTSFMDMPNTLPQTTTIQAWQEKMEIAAEKSFANYSFYLGATNDNLFELEKADYSQVCGVKVFMGSSTGNMLVGQKESLEAIFKTIPSIIAVHAESEAIIQANKAKYTEELGGDLPLRYHPLIRSSEACYASSAIAVEMAARYHSRLHVLHVSTEKELSLFENAPLASKRITAEACVSHLWFDDADYEHYGNAIKCNPAIKTRQDKEALRAAVAGNLLDVIATDHAPHLWAEKQGNCLTAASGSPSVQFSLPLMLELVHQGVFCKEKVIEKMCHAPSDLYRIDKRGYIREGYYADMVLIDPQASWTLSGKQILSKCGWSPFEGQHFHTCVYQTYLNGKLVYEQNKPHETKASKALKFHFE